MVQAVIRLAMIDFPKMRLALPNQEDLSAQRRIERRTVEAVVGVEQTRMASKLPGGGQLQRVEVPEDMDLPLGPDVRPEADPGEAVPVPHLGGEPLGDVAVADHHV